MLPSIYHRAKIFGSEPVKDVFPASDIPRPSTDLDVINRVSTYLKNTAPGQLVAITHWEEGAWAEYYRPGVRHITIPNKAIRDEYLRRAKVAPT